MTPPLPTNTYTLYVAAKARLASSYDAQDEALVCLWERFGAVCLERDNLKEANKKMEKSIRQSAHYTDILESRCAVLANEKGIAVKSLGVIEE